MRKYKGKNLELWIVLGTLAAVLLVLGGILLAERITNRSSVTLTEEEAQVKVRETVDTLPLKVSDTSVAMAEKLELTVQSVEYGTEKDIILHTSYKTVDLLSAYRAHRDEIFTDVYRLCKTNDEAGKKTSSTDILVFMSQEMEVLMGEATPKEGEIDLYLYDMGDGTVQMYLDDTVVDTLFGGLLTIRGDVDATTEIVYEGETVNIVNNNSLRRGVRDCFGLSNYSSEKPDTSAPLTRALNSLSYDFERNFIQDEHWKYLTTGLGNTLAITGLALVLGVFIGFITAVVRVTHDKEGKLSILNAICNIYVTIIRGTPVMIQLMIIYFVLLLPIGIEKFPAAVLCFGLNSGAYVSEIIRGGIMSVDGGQMEAGRSIGFGYASTMIFIVLPQAFKAVLPALCNEFIALLKETSIAFYIGVADLTQGGLKIRSITYSNFMPLIAIAVIYLVMVLALTWLVGLLEKKLRKSER